MAAIVRPIDAGLPEFLLILIFIFVSSGLLTVGIEQTYKVRSYVYGKSLGSQAQPYPTEIVPGQRKGSLIFCMKTCWTESRWQAKIRI